MEETTNKTKAPNDEQKEHQDKRRSSSEPSEFFEFLTSDFTAGNMSHAEDIIFSGKLVPFRHHHQFLIKSLSADDATRFSTVRSNTRPRHDKTLRCSRRRDRTRSEPKWFVLMLFGPLKLHPEMDIRELRSRGGRRGTAGGDIQAGRSGRKSLWGFDLLRVLSCKSRTSVAVTSVGLGSRF